MHEFDRVEFARTVYSRLTKRRWTEAVLARKANISQSQVSRILNAKLKRFNASHARLCIILHIRRDEFIGEKGKSKALCDTIHQICAGKRQRAAALATILANVLRLTNRE
jgi:transcriptional regulator with XRE-family HTH domain